MEAVLPGKPEARLQALATGFWDGRRIIAYLTGNAFTVLSAFNQPIQIVYGDDASCEGGNNVCEPLQAIAIDEATGKIATSTLRTVRIYAPLKHGQFQLKWQLESHFDISKDGTTAPCLSWARQAELLVAQNSLRLYETGWKTFECIWDKPLANATKFAAISYDSDYIACVGYHDRLVKIWRRYGGEGFDFSYLRHPAPITGLRWRQPHDTRETLINVLYTFCADNILRIWTGGGKLPRPKFWGELNLHSCIQHGDDAARDAPARRWAFIIDSRDFNSAATQALADGKPDKDALSHLAGVANRTPELCIVLDGYGSMSAWGFENIGYDAQPNIFNIAHAKSKDLCFAKNVPADELPHIEILSFANKGAGHLQILLHHFDGRIQVFACNIAELLVSAPVERRMQLQCVWSGHSSPISKIVRNYSGRAIVSRTAQGEGVVWVHPKRHSKLLRWSLFPETGYIHRICVMRKGRFVAFLMHEKVSIWDCRQKHAKLLWECSYVASGKPLCSLILPRQNREDYAIVHIATVTSENDGLVWEVRLPLYLDRSMKTHVDNYTPGIKEFCRFQLPGASDLAYVLPVDPAGADPVVSVFLDVFARDIAISWTTNGLVNFWTARVNIDRGKVEWLSTASFDTGIVRPALASGSMMKKAALVTSDRKEVSIWDIKGAQLEWAESYEHEKIRDLDWTATPDQQSILAVGFETRLILLSQMRYDYLNKRPSWAAIREINLGAMTPWMLGDSTWLGDGHLVLGAGNQLFLYGRDVDIPREMRADLQLPGHKPGKWDLFEVVRRLNGPLPVFHPQFLSQCMQAGKIHLMYDILMALYETLKFYVDGDVIEGHLGMNTENFYQPSDHHQTGGSSSLILQRRPSMHMHHRHTEQFSEETSEYIREKLQKISLPYISPHEQIQLVDLVECAGEVEKQRRSMDENGAIFMLFFRQHALMRGRVGEMHLSWREVVWAYHSNCHDILLDFVTRQYRSLTWQSARESGMFMWLSDNAAVKRQFEIVARNEYSKNDFKNPIDCSLHYLALRKKAVLQGLWRMAAWNNEQTPTMKLLAHDFSDPKWQTTAMKNAYALMGKHRFEYAAAFFLLADRLKDAVNVCLNQLKDLQLAIAVARTYEGDDGPVLRELLEENVLALAAKQGNRWLASWAFWMLNRKDMAVRALVTPVHELLDKTHVERESKLFLTDDPALAVFYAQLRRKTLQTLHGASQVSPRAEWEFVLHAARIYDRMGCDLLGLDLVRNWEFLRTPLVPKSQHGGTGPPHPARLLSRRASLVIADLPVNGLRAADKDKDKDNDCDQRGVGSESNPSSLGSDSQKPKPKPPPTMFNEPDPNSLLDSFGF